MAMKSISDQICDSYTSRKDEKLLVTSEIIILSHHKNSFSAMFRHDTRFIDLVHCVMNYAVTCKLKYDVQLLQAQTSDVARYMQSFRFIQDARLSTSGRHTRVAKLFLKINNWFMFFACY